MATERVNIVVTEKGSRVVKRRLMGVGASATKSAAGVNLLRTALIGIGGALVLTQTVRTLANFGQAMSTVKAVSGATEEQWKSLTNVALELGAVTRFTATQAAEGLVELARAGFSVNEQLGSIEQTLFLAQAGALDLSRAAEITVGTLRGFRLEVDQANRVTDVLAFAANAASTDVDQLGEAMKFVAPIAAGMSVSLEETVAALQSLADAQLKAAMGGTGLRQVMSELESPSLKTRKIMKSLGVHVDEVRITTVGLTAALERLHKAGVTTGLALEIFGRRGGPAFEVMSNAVPKIKAAHAALLQSQGTVKSIAKIMDDNLNGALLRVKSAYEAVQLAFGQQGGSSVLVRMADAIAGALRFLANHIHIVEGVFLALAIGAIPKLVAALWLLRGALGVFAIGAVIGAMVSFRHEIKLSSDGIVSLGDFAAATWERMREGATVLLDLFKSALPNISGLWHAMFGDLDLSFEGFIKGSARILDAYIGLWVGVVNVIKVIWRGLGPALKDITISLLNGIIGVFEAGLKKILGTIDAIASKIPGVGKIFGDVAGLAIIPRIENAAEGALISIDRAIAKGFAEGSKTSIFEDSINAIFNRAEQKAQIRLDKIAFDTGGSQTDTTGDGAPTSQSLSRAFEISLGLIQEQIDLLHMSAAARQIEIELRKQEITLSKMGIMLTEEQRNQLGGQLQRLQVVKQVATALDTVRGAEINLAAAQGELNRQVESGTISLQQAAEAYRILQTTANETSRTISAGWSRGLASIRDTVTDLATATETTLVNAFNSAEDALVDFVTTGKINFKSMVDSMLADLTRLLARLMFMKAIEGAIGIGLPLGGLLGGAAAGGVGAGASSVTAGATSMPGMASGGPVEPGKLYQVGESGRELFAPSVPGQIIPNDQVEKALGKETEASGGGDVVIINVSSREEALAAMGSTQGKRIIVNIMGETERARI